jgi:4-diphosphocytidyl-2-C-methyl-D-erythritol kinase
MSQIVVRALAKVNWLLNVIGKRTDGYHELEMVMQSIALYDLVFIREKGDGIKLRCNWPAVPLDNRNTAYKAAALIKKKFALKRGVEITIRKNIPLAAGMAGGSADAAAVLVGLCKMWDLKVEQKDLMNMAASIGSDVPFCILGGTALARGRGDILTALPSAHGIWIVLVTPDFYVSTAQVYDSLDIDQITVKPKLQAMVKSLANDDLIAIGRYMTNVLEEVTLRMHPQVAMIKEDMLNQGALGCSMSGSGPTVFGIFPNMIAAQKGYDVLKRRYSQCFIVQTKAYGTEIMEESL